MSINHWFDGSPHLFQCAECPTPGTFPTAGTLLQHYRRLHGQNLTFAPTVTDGRQNETGTEYLAKTEMRHLRAHIFQHRESQAAPGQYTLRNRAEIPVRRPTLWEGISLSFHPCPIQTGQASRQPSHPSRVIFRYRYLIHSAESREKREERREKREERKKFRKSSKMERRYIHPCSDRRAMQ